MRMRSSPESQTTPARRFSSVPRLLAATTIGIAGLLGAERSRGEEPKQNQQQEWIRNLANDDYFTRAFVTDRLKESLSALPRGGWRAALEPWLNDPDTERQLRCRDISNFLTIEDMWKPSMVSLRFCEETSRMNVFTEIKRQSGNPVGWRDMSERTLGKTMNGYWDEGPYWDVLERFARDTGNVIEMAENTQWPPMVLREGVSFAPAVNEGPFRLSVAGLRQTAKREIDFEKATRTEEGKLSLQIKVLAEPGRSIVQSESRPRVLAAVTDTGESIAVSDCTSSNMSAHYAYTRPACSSEIALRPPDKPAKSVRLLLEWCCMQAGDFQTLSFDDLTPGTTINKRGMQMTVLSHDVENGRIDILCERDRWETDDRMSVGRHYSIEECKDAQGQSSPAVFLTTVSAEEGFTMKLDCRSGPISSLRIKAPALLSTRSTRFAVDAPLTSENPK